MSTDLSKAYVQNVTIVRPKPDPKETWTAIAVGLAFLPLKAWLLMLALGILGFPLGYGHALVLILAAKWLIPTRGSGYMFWTRKPVKS